MTIVNAKAPKHRRSQKRRKQPTVRVEMTEADIFVVADGVRIAKRGHPGTPQARQWVSLEPGWHVRDAGDDIEIMREGAEVH